MHKFSFWDYDMAGRSRSRLAFFLPAFIFCLACGSTSEPSPEAPSSSFLSFYHWQTAFQLDSLEQDRLEALGVDRLYLKFFDLDWDFGAGEVVPLASIQLDTNGLRGRQIIPAVFITNRSMLHIAPEEIPELAARIREKIDRQFAALGQPLREVQLDCDWTGRSRANYFALLQELQSLYDAEGIELSLTIRLHQVRYPRQTGVPPLKKGVLMFYNMGDLQRWDEPNSILNLDKAAAYLPAAPDYPLQLDLALPLFRWAVLFRDGKMIKLINEPEDALFEDQEKYRQTGSGRYQVLQSTYLRGHLLYEGDLIRVETVSPADLRAAYDLVNRQYPAAARNLIYYHLDEGVLERFVPSDLDLN